MESVVTKDITELYSSYFNRYESLRKQIVLVDDNNIAPANYIDIITSSQSEKGDSFHLLVMDIHKELNRLQLYISQESIDGASVYGLTKDDKNLVKSYML